MKVNAIKGTEHKEKVKETIRKVGKKRKVKKEEGA